MHSTAAIVFSLVLITVGMLYVALRRQLSNNASLALSSLVTVVVFSSTSGVWFVLKNEIPPPPLAMEPMTIEQVMEEKQQHLTGNPNDAKAWFELGQLYMGRYEFDSATTCFDYAIRLSKAPYAGQFAALATAQYYQHSQTITADVQRLLDITLEMDPFNETALQLIASDHFMSARYEQAIAHWTMILDSDRLGVDRAKVIGSINQALSFIR
ncbi:hypothetical protein AB4304_05125 [Vibrio breoganii]|uniref:Cytochrome c-type biogenesis protein H TPR domain-containing protein n=1 Tax=Vibrio breoganii TaxID=553239 RepID=A0AAN1CTG1_9VIBR|nr:hypothetical protein [Vibrio breoganii]ANO34447.1 hypothetical protein A6E01_14685 [Vibrio breoganii]OED92989.1 hypothetical protein A1QE_05760 [Vibrio breoganii ZF-55]PMK45008.1 hypothetical protein BCU00_08810 [Vibrio breoganii]PMO34764.1 hypothetical protein BCT12_12825 [Vibrio breoganii]PMO58764.1 hypothetical protein BCT07_10950 [Vibrio breoganii]